MLIGILADTHIQSHHIKKNAYRKIVEQLHELFKEVDHIIHAGDVCTLQFLRDLETIAPVTYCRGNCDRNLPGPSKQEITLETVSIGIAHFPENISAFDPDAIQVFIHGHTHFPSIKETDKGILVVCPGSLLNPRPRTSHFLFKEDSTPRPSVAFINIIEDQVSAIIKKL